MDDDWDLHAVVRSCSSSAATTTETSTTTIATAADGGSRNFEEDWNFSSTWFEDLFEPRRENFIEELHDILKPFSPIPQDSSQIGLFSQQNLPISPLSVLGGLQDLSSEQQQQQQQVIKKVPQQKQHLFSVSKPSPRPKKRKNHLKRVCHVPAEGLSSDTWSWRKYGQKPIKGSPYPRGYYKCSTIKGCMARKQVERNRSDPGVFIVTYTGDHSHPMPTHRNSLAGSTRQKPADTPVSDESKKPEMSPESNLSPAPEKLESSPEDLAEVEDDEDDIDFSVSNMALDDDFFVGLEDFDHIQADLQFPWLANSATTTTTAAGGGG